MTEHDWRVTIVFYIVCLSIAAMAPISCMFMDWRDYRKNKRNG